MRTTAAIIFSLFIFSCSKREKHIDTLKVNTDSALTVDNFKKEQAKSKKVEYDFNDGQYDAR